MHAAISDFHKLYSGFFSECVFSNIDEMHYHPVLKLISVLNNFINNNAEKTKSFTVYSANGHSTCLNNWEDEHYFTRTFSMLFPFGDGGHLAKCKTAILLQVWAK